MSCLLCASTADLLQVTLEPRRTPADEAMLCDACRSHLEGASLREAAACAFLRDTIWSTDEVTQALSWRMLSRYAGEAWATELLEQVWLDEGLAAWAAAGLAAAAAGDCMGHFPEEKVVIGASSRTVVEELEPSAVRSAAQCAGDHT